MRSVGVTCTPRIAYLTLAIDGAIAGRLSSGSKWRLSTSRRQSCSPRSPRSNGALGQLRPDLVVLLMPEQGRHKRTYQEIAPRVALETLVRIAAVQENVAIEVPPRPTVRARLGVPRAGDLASHVGRAIVEPVGRYGDSKEYEIERLYGDAPLLLIGEGTCEIPRMVIGKKLLQRQPR